MEADTRTEAAFPGTEVLEAEPALRNQARKSLLLAIVTLGSLAYLIGLLHYGHVRPIDADEGFYTTAARLVWESKTPYRDFFYQQAPLLPYLYSWIWAVHPRSLVGMRTFSAACGGLAVFLWGFGLFSLKRLPTKIATATFAAVLLNPYWVQWNVVVKTFAVSNLLASIAMLSLYAALHSKRVRWYFAAGLALGVCASVRSLHGPLIPAVLLWILWREWRTAGPPYLKTLTFLGGSVCGLLPMIFSFVRDPHAFIFNNITYHGLDAGYLWVGGGKIVTGYQSAEHVFSIYMVFILYRILAVHPYFIAELVVAGSGIASWLKLRTKREEPYTNEDYSYFQLAFLTLTVYTVTALIPFPPYDQYFDSPMVPFLVPFVAEGLRLAFRRGIAWVAVLAVVAPILFWTEIPRLSPNGIFGRPRSYGAWELAPYRKIAETIEANSHPNDVVLSFWPGYVFESGRQYFPGLEDHLVYRIMSRISPEERARYHVAGKDQIMTALSARAAGVIVMAPAEWMAEYDYNLSPEEIKSFQASLESGYSRVSEIDDVKIYRRR